MRLISRTGLCRVPYLLPITLFAVLTVFVLCSAAFAAGVTVTINQAATQPDPTSVIPVHFTAVFSEAVTGFDGTDVNIPNASGATYAVVTDSGDHITYDVAVYGQTKSGKISVNIPSGAATSILTGQTSGTATSTDSIVTFNYTGPEVGINQASGQADPTNGSPINFTVTFVESVNDFATGDVALSGTAGATTATVTGSGTTYNVAVSGMTASGTVIASVPAGVAHNTRGDANVASYSTDNTVTYDITPPAVTINQAVGQADPTNASPINFTVVFSKSVADFSTGDVTISGTAGGTKTATVTGSGTTYNVAVTGMTGTGTVIATVGAGVANDSVGNANTASTSTDNTVAYDGAGPTVTIDQESTQSDPTSELTIDFTVVFDEPVTDFATGDVTIAGTAGGTKTATVTGSGTTYNVSVTGMTSSGTVVASLAAGVAHDAFGQASSASTSTDNTVTFHSMRGDWWKMRRDMEQRAVSSLVGPSNAKLRWRFPTASAVYSSPATDIDGAIYFGSSDGNVYAVDAAGAQKWTFATGNEVLSSPAIGHDGTVYIGSTDTYVYAISPSGLQSWRFATTDEVLSSPTIGIDGTVVVGSLDGKVYAINADGTEKWTFPTGGIVASSPAIGPDGTIYAASADSKVYAINPDGTQKWQFVTGGQVLSSAPTVGTDGTVYIGSMDCNLYAINPTGSEKWRFTTGGAINSSPALASDGTVYITSRDGYLRAINSLGSQAWAFAIGAGSQSSPAVDSAGNVFVGSADGKIYGISPSGNLRWSWLTGSAVNSSPAIGADGTLYFGSYDGFLYAMAAESAVTPAVTAISPNTAGDTGAVSVTISGTGFAAGATVALTMAGQTSIAGKSVTVTGQTSISCSFDLTAKAAGAWDVVVTNADGNSGSLSAGFTVQATNTAPQVISLSPNSGALPIESKTTLTSVYRDADGSGNIRRCYLMINETGVGANGIYIKYDQLTNKIYLADDGGVNLGVGYTLGTPVVLSNSQCELYVADTTAAGSGTDLTVNWSLKLKASQAGRALYSWMYAADNSGSTSGWVKTGTHFGPMAPVCVSVTPSTGSASCAVAQTFNAAYSDGNGFGNLSQCYFQLSVAGSAVNSIYLYYDAVGNKVYLRNDANSSWGTGYAPGTAATLSNSQCSVSVANTTVTTSGANGLIVNWNITIQGTQAGKKLLEKMYVRDRDGLISGWLTMGSITAL